MSLPLFIIFAVLLPLALLAGIYLFSRGTIRMALRPRTAGVIFMVFGAFFGGFGVWEARAGLNLESIFFMIGGVMFIINGIYTWFRGVPQSLEGCAGVDGRVDAGRPCQERASFTAT